MPEMALYMPGRQKQQNDTMIVCVHALAYQR